MPSSRHVGHRVGVRVCVVYEAAYYVARVYSPARKQAQSVTTCPRASARSLALASRGNVPLAGGWRVRATRGMIERDVGRRDLGVHISADTFALKRTLISGGRIRIQPPRMCLHVPRGEGDGGLGTGELGVARGRRDGVNAQFVFRSGGKTRSLHRIARRTRRNSSLSPTFVSSLDSSR